MSAGRSVSVVAAMSANRVIGRDNALPWTLKADLRHFKRLTMGGTLIMGRRTFESIGRPLPGRSTVVVTRSALRAPGVLVAGSIEEALRVAPGPEVFIAGGAEIYRQTLELAGKLHLTVLEMECEGDAFFPDIDPSRWHLSSEERHAGEGGEPAYRFVTYERIMSDLTKETCVACRAGAPQVTPEEAASLMTQIPEWGIVEKEGVARLIRSFTFPDFARALAFTDKVGALAEEQDHHPEIVTEYGRVTVSWWTHKIHGLHRNDFVMAARTDRLIAV